MAKARMKRGLGGAALKAAAAGQRSARADIRVEEERSRQEGTPHLLPLERIGERPNLEIRALNEEHVEALAESIRYLGLIQPISLDREHRLVAGAHRLAAFRRLHGEEPERWAKIPVIIDPELDASVDPERALRREIAENEKRRNLTAAQVKAAAARLLELDPSFTLRRGRPRRGERPLTPLLASTFGVSTRHIRSLLGEGTATRTPAPAPGALRH